MRHPHRGPTAQPRPLRPGLRPKVRRPRGSTYRTAARRDTRIVDSSAQRRGARPPTAICIRYCDLRLPIVRTFVVHSCWEGQSANDACTADDANHASDIMRIAPPATRGALESPGASGPPLASRAQRDAVPEVPGDVRDAERGGVPGRLIDACKPAAPRCLARAPRSRARSARDALTTEPSRLPLADDAVPSAGARSAMVIARRSEGPPVPAWRPGLETLETAARRRDLVDEEMRPRRG